jgi:NRAMP (natural resistance-associated macrophage protein)-like metal ion transporter
VLDRLRRFVRILGPGLVAGASDDDPSGIGTYAQAGAAFGYSTLWTALLTFPLTATVQYICAKVALVSGRGMAGVLRRQFPAVIVYPAVFALVVANTITAGADIGAIAAALELIVPLPAVIYVAPIAIGIVVLLLLGSYELLERIFKWLTLALLAYVASALFTSPDLGEVLRNTFIPTISVDPAFVLMLVALLGTTISPYLFFYVAEDEVESEISIGRRRIRQRKGASPKELTFAGWDVTTGIGFSNLVFYFVVLASGGTLHQEGRRDLQSAADAARALQPIAGDAAGFLFAAGIIGSGFLAVPILATSASYAVTELFGWPRGLDEKPGGARRFYALIAAAALVGMLVNFLGINPIDALVLAAVINGFVAPPLLVLILLVANDRDVMGRRTNRLVTNVVGWATAALMGMAAIAWVMLTVVS